MTPPSNNYSVKATQPAGNPWQERNLTRSAAEQRAKWFVRQWCDNGLITAEASVFYCGSRTFTATIRNCD